MTNLWLNLAVIAVSLGSVISVTSLDDPDYFTWNYSKYPYKTFYLEDYCSKKACKEESPANTFYLNSTGPNSGAIIRSFRHFSHLDSSNRHIECCLSISTATHRQIALEVEIVDLEDRKGDCDVNFLELSNVEGRPGKICNKAPIATRSLTTFSNFLSLRLSVDTGTDDWNEQTVKLVVTSIYTPSLSLAVPQDTHALEHARDRVVSSMLSDISADLGDESCDAHETFLCDNGRCIWEGFKCDEHNNCGDASDELYCDFFTRNWEAIIWISLCAIALAALIGVCCCCWCGSRRKYTYVEGGFTKTAPNRVERIYGSTVSAPERPLSSAPPLYPQQPPPPYNMHYGPVDPKAPLLQNQQPPAYFH